MSDKYRSEYAKQLSWLHSILDQKGFIKDLKPLYDSIQRCKKTPGGIDNLWQHQLYKLNFGPIQSLNKIRPADARNLNLLLTIECLGKCQDDPGHDIVDDLRFDISVKGLDSSKNKIITAWHLDCHLVEEGDGKPDHSHPFYHFQHGGETILNLDDDDDYDFGSTLFLESPRIAHPPMDIILGVNYVLSQFYGQYWRDLMKEPRYLSLVRDSQKRLWKPYYKKIASYFEYPQHHKEAKELLPDLVK